MHVAVANIDLDQAGAGAMINMRSGRYRHRPHAQ